MSYQLQFYFLWLPKLRQNFPKECTALKLHFWTKFYATERDFFFFPDCIKAQNPVSSGTFLFLFSFTSSMAKSPCVLSFSAPLISLTIFTWRKSPTNHANGVPDLVLWSHLPIHPQIPFSQAHSIPAASLCSQTLKKQKQQQHNQLARWTQVSLHVCCLKPQAKFVFHIFLWKIENRFWREYNGRFVFVFFSPFKYGCRTCGRHVVPV